MTIDGLTRREFLALSGMLGAGLVLSPVGIVRATEEDLEALSKKYIPFMTKPVSVTLNPGETHVREVTPRNYDRMVYGNKMGSLVLNVSSGIKPAEEGLASVFRALDEKYHGKIDFFVFYDNKYPDHCGNRSEITCREGIEKPPSIVMYSPFDLLKGETLQKNNGKIKRIDIERAGFSNPSIWAVCYQSLNDWLRTNIIQPNGEYCWRFENQGNKTKRNY